MDFSHKLPAHLGGWPCKIVRTASSWAVDQASTGDVSQTLALVEYEFAPGSGDVHDTRRLYVLASDLERIVPAEPSTPYVEGADGKVYRMLPGREPGTNERLWQKVHGAGPVMTWTVLTQTWADQDKGEPVVPLAPAQPMQLPFEITSSDADRIKVRIADNLQRQVCLELADRWTWCEADEAEHVAWALLSAVWQVRRS